MARSGGTRRQSGELGLLRPKGGMLLLPARSGDGRGVTLQARCRPALAVSGQLERVATRADFPKHGRGGDFLKGKNHQGPGQPRGAQQATDFRLAACRT